MVIGQTLRKLRETKGLSQGDIESKTGMLRCYISRVENGHTVPSLETVERFAAALDVPVYELFYNESEGPEALQLAPRPGAKEAALGVAARPEDEKFLQRFQNLVARLRERDRRLLLTLAGRMAIAGQS
jgi:transcriptional regulator with XRE-family HTH domain